MKQIFAVFFFLTVSALAQLATPALNTQAVNGTFYLTIDDSARVLVNGVEAHYNAKTGKYQSKEVALKPGDHVVVQLKNVQNPRYLLMAFQSTDKKSVVSFNHQSFKLLPTIDAKDFTPEDFAKLSKYAKADPTRKRDNTIPFKHTSEYMWGEFDECALGCIITSQMFVPVRQ